MKEVRMTQAEFENKIKTLIFGSEEYRKPSGASLLYGDIMKEIERLYDVDYRMEELKK